MLKLLTASAAAVALSVQVASASPFNASVSAGNPGQAERPAQRDGVIAFFVSRVASAVAGKTGQPTDGAASPYYYKDSQCEEAEAVDGDDSGEEQAKNAEPMGPEPIYYGF